MASPMLQHAFASALIDPDCDVPEGFVAPEGKSASRRFAIYRNNVTVSLVNALAEIFPTVQNLVGEEFFRAMARLYVQAHPPRSRLLFEYGENFAEFIEAFEPARPLGYLGDVARLERLWLDVFHATDTTPLDANILATIPPERLGDICFRAHPATRLFQGRHAAVSIVSRDRSGETLTNIDPLRPEDGLITRPQFDPQLRHIPQGAATFIACLLTGESLGEAAAKTIETQPDFDIGAALGALLEAGTFSAVLLDGKEI